MSAGEVILEAVDLAKHFGTGGGWFPGRSRIRAVDGVSLRVRRGETLAIVGESGSGKSTLARLLMRLIEPSAGHVLFDGRRIDDARGAALRSLRGAMQFVFQDPFAALNPRMTVGAIVGEPLEVHAPAMTPAERRRAVGDLLAKVGLSAEHAGRYAHEFSGGQRQRIGIARALASAPTLIIADEPVSALDVSVQAQVINLLDDLRRDLGLTLVIIAHDLGVIRHMSDRVAVMYLGRLVETGPTDALYRNPRHPYTRALLASIPGTGSTPERHARMLSGEMPSPSAPPPGCRFHTRCPHRRDLCSKETPGLVGTDHAVACHFWQEIAPEPRAGARDPLSDAAKARFALYRAATEGGTVTHKQENQTRPTERI